MIVTEAVSDYLASLRSAPDSVLAEMEAQASREGIPIVVPETGAFLHVLALAHLQNSFQTNSLNVQRSMTDSPVCLPRSLPRMRRSPERAIQYHHYLSQELQCLRHSRRQPMP